MEKIYAPWRDQYVRSHVKEKNASLKQECIFCLVFDEKINLERHFILYRSADIAILLNLYPYAAGHVLLVTRYHQEQFFTLPLNLQHLFMEALSISSEIIMKALQSDGLNLGANIGKAAGAGIPDHVHFHVVPRWFGDTNFFPVLSDTKQISVDLKKTYQQLQPLFTQAFAERK